MPAITIGNRQITIGELAEVAYGKAEVALCADRDYRERISDNVAFLREIIKGPMPIYGTTTGFGASCVQYLPEEHARQLQRQLIRYHRCGTGQTFSPEQTTAIMVARLVSLARGYSGVSYLLLETLTQMINCRITPLVPVEGSVGASGDLTPLAYIAAAMSGEGEVRWQGKTMPALDALQRNNIAPFEFGPKEALAVINGTSVMAAIFALVCLEVERLCQTAETLTALVVQVLKGKQQAFDDRIHRLKPFQGQLRSASAIYQALAKGPLLSDYREQAAGQLASPNEPPQRLPFKVQDVYSLRCAPHVIGVARDTLSFCVRWVETEVNAVTDNPLVFTEDREVLLGGNFYGGHIAHAADNCKIVLGHLADLADRQLALIVDDKFSNGLPGNLVMSIAGQVMVDHGFKAMQIAASAPMRRNIEKRHPGRYLFQG